MRQFWRAIGAFEGLVKVGTSLSTTLPQPSVSGDSFGTPCRQSSPKSRSTRDWGCPNPYVDPAPEAIPVPQARPVSVSRSSPSKGWIPNWPYIRPIGLLLNGANPVSRPTPGIREKIAPEYSLTVLSQLDAKLRHRAENHAWLASAIIPSKVPFMIRCGFAAVWTVTNSIRRRRRFYRRFPCFFRRRANEPSCDGRRIHEFQQRGRDRDESILGPICPVL